MKNYTSYIVELEGGVWLASGHGDPPRTLVRDNAKRFNTEGGANRALREARYYRPFLTAKVEEA